MCTLKWCSFDGIWSKVLSQQNEDQELKFCLESQALYRMIIYSFRIRVLPYLNIVQEMSRSLK